ncbi:hypothetical protein KCU67_g2214, partial [Aureobasidium melanogenum]
MADDTFHPFPQLPTELREEIWRYCLPHRVSEMDNPANFIVYFTREDDDNDKRPCSLGMTTFNNNHPPLLTRVCRESRRIAFQSGNWATVIREKGNLHRASEPEWEAMNFIYYDYWQDPLRDSAHLNWTPAYDADLGCTTDGHPLKSLVQESKLLNGSASIMLDYMSDTLMELEPFDKPITQQLENIPIQHDKQEDLAALKLLLEWLVVVRVIIIHLDFAQAAKTGLFGLLGDEPVQIVDAASPLVSQLYELAETCERGAYAVTAAQNFTQMSASDMDTMVKRVAFKAFHDLELPKRMRPAIMFRLCTEMCNHSDTPGEEPKVWTT